MKNILLLLLFVITNSCAQRQDNYKGFDSVTHNSKISLLHGKWKISELISNAETKEYILTPQSSDKSNNYGNNISLNTDQSFVSSYSADCGNDCFTTTNGKYKIMDENYICFYLEEIIRSGECSGNSNPNKDLGLYYYYKDENGFRLLRSVGNLEQDKKNVYYYDLIVAKRKEIDEFYYRNGQNQSIYNWKQTNLKDEKEIVVFCMKENKIQDYEILFSHKGDIYSRLNIILVKINNQFHYVLYDTWGNPMVSLYNDSPIQKINQLVNKIDNNTSLNKTEKKTTIPQNNSTSETKVITVYKNSNEINKVIYARYYEYYGKMSVSTITIYLDNSTPIYIDYLSSPDIKNLISETGLYVLDWQNNIGANKYIKHGNGRLDKHLVSDKRVINDILQEIKN